MMEYPLLLKNMLYRANLLFPKKEIVSRDFSGIWRYTYADMYKRVCRLANVLKGLGIKQGDKVGSFAWNTHRHLELYFAVPCIGDVLHTINIRLFRDHLIHCINHAEDKILFIDEDLVPLIEAVKDEIDVRAYVIMTDRDKLPETTLSPVYSYEALLDQADDDYDFPYLDEWSPAVMSYTTATTGFPKGVVYTHRGLYLHCTAVLMGKTAAWEEDVAMPVVPMFHVNAWGRPYADTWIGAKQVYPGPHPTSQDLCELIHNERVSYSVGVPTIWMGVLNHALENPGKYDFSCTRVFWSGGAATPVSLIEAFHKQLGIPLHSGYGQTETTPVTALAFLKSYMEDWPENEKFKILAKTGLLQPGLEMKVIKGSLDGEVARDGKDIGELLLKGPWIMKEYYKDPEKTAEAFIDGWFRTGDIVTFDEEGYIQVMDRTKDLIKSGGEWISSVDLENTIMNHPGVAEAAVIGIPHEKWGERPLACIVLKPQSRGQVTKEDILDFLRDKVAKWWLPDEVVFIEEIPRTSVGKFLKSRLREMYAQGQMK